MKQGVMNHQDSRAPVFSTRALEGIMCCTEGKRVYIYIYMLSRLYHPNGGTLIFLENPRRKVLSVCFLDESTLGRTSQARFAVTRFHHMLPFA